MKQHDDVRPRPAHEQAQAQAAGKAAEGKAGTGAGATEGEVSDQAAAEPVAGAGAGAEAVDPGVGDLDMLDMLIVLSLMVLLVLGTAIWVRHGRSPRHKSRSAAGPFVADSDMFPGTRTVLLHHRQLTEEDFKIPEMFSNRSVRPARVRGLDSIRMAWRGGPTPIGLDELNITEEGQFARWITERSDGQFRYQRRATVINGGLGAKFNAVGRWVSTPFVCEVGFFHFDREVVIAVAGISLGAHTDAGEGPCRGAVTFIPGRRNGGQCAAGDRAVPCREGNRSREGPVSTEAIRRSV